jgi:hypothetical protein
VESESRVENHNNNVTQRSKPKAAHPTVERVDDDDDDDGNGSREKKKLLFLLLLLLSMVSKEEKEDVSCGDCCDKQGEESAARGNELTEMQM